MGPGLACWADWQRAAGGGWLGCFPRLTPEPAGVVASLLGLLSLPVCQSCILRQGAQTGVFLSLKVLPGVWEQETCE